MDLVQILFTFNGRMSRGHYWRAVLVYVCAWILAFLILAGIALAFGARHISMSAGIVPLLLSIPISIKRLHDRDRSGWWLLVFYVLPLILSMIAETADMGLDFILSFANAALLLWGFIELGCLRGTPGRNRFGPDPLAS
jgi:uncharacterized membrane protein YhaH (DUF805 family)